MQKHSWTVELSRGALKALDRMERSVQLRIRDRIRQLEALENPLRHKDVRDLAGKFQGYYRLRVGEYRLIFELDPMNRKISVNAIAPRGSAY
jgi:mRNA interferase RelE/StbE